MEGNPGGPGRPPGSKDLSPRNSYTAMKELIAGRIMKVMKDREDQEVQKSPAAPPGPEEVRFRWNHRFETTFGVCYPKGNIIEVNVMFQDPRLSQELEYLMIHEAAHFIWRHHSPAFRAFLRRVGVRSDYIPAHGEASPLYRLVQAEQAQRQLRLFEW